MSTRIREVAKSVNISEENIRRLVDKGVVAGLDDRSFEIGDFKDMEETDFQDFTKGILDEGKSNEFLAKLKEASSGGRQKQPAPHTKRPARDGGVPQPGAAPDLPAARAAHAGPPQGEPARDAPEAAGAPQQADAGRARQAPPRGPFLSAGNTLLSNGRKPKEMAFSEIMEMIQGDGVFAPTTSDLRAIQSHVEYLYKKAPFPIHIGKNNLIQFNSIVPPKFRIASGGGGKRKYKKRKSKRKQIRKSKRKQSKKSRKRSKTRRRR